VGIFGLRKPNYDRSKSKNAEPKTQKWAFSGKAPGFEGCSAIRMEKKKTCCVLLAVLAASSFPMQGCADEKKKKDEDADGAVTCSAPLATNCAMGLAISGLGITDLTNYGIFRYECEVSNCADSAEVLSACTASEYGRAMFTCIGLIEHTNSNYSLLSTDAPVDPASLRRLQEGAPGREWQSSQYTTIYLEPADIRMSALIGGSGIPPCNPNKR
jgi:hypothetical protein